MLTVWGPLCIILLLLQRTNNKVAKYNLFLYVADNIN